MDDSEQEQDLVNNNDELDEIEHNCTEEIQHDGILNQSEGNPS